MKKIIIHNTNIEPISSKDTLENAKYIILYDNLNDCYDGQVISSEYTNVYFTRFSVDAEGFLADYCEEREESDAIDVLYVYEAVDPSEVGYTQENHKRYIEWWNSESCWKTYYKTLDEFLASMKTKDEAKANKLVELAIEDKTFYVMSRNVDYGTTITAQIQ